MLYITLVSLILTIISFLYFFLQVVKKNIFQEKVNDYKLKLIISSSCIILFWLLTYSLNTVYERIQNPIKIGGIEQYPGTLGDLVGGTLNPILGLFGIIVGGLAFYAQYQANKQVQEQFVKQEKKEYRQNFENIFFNLINIHHQIVSDIDINTKKIYHFEEDLKEFIQENSLINDSFTTNLIDETDYSSRDVFNYYFNLLDYLIWIDLQIMAGDNLEEYIDDVEKFEKIFKEKHKITYRDYSLITRFPSIYLLTYNTISSDFGHYFRNVYRIIKYVDSMSFSDNLLEDFQIKYSYTSIVRAQLSDAELKVIFFNCLCFFGKDKFKPLLEKYSFFKFINTDENDTDNVFKDFYKFYDLIAFQPILDEQQMNLYLNKQSIDELVIEKTDDKIEIKLSL